MKLPDELHINPLRLAAVPEVLTEHPAVPGWRAVEVQWRRSSSPSGEMIGRVVWEGESPAFNEAGEYQFPEKTRIVQTFEIGSAEIKDEDE